MMSKGFGIDKRANLDKGKEHVQLGKVMAKLPYFLSSDRDYFFSHESFLTGV
jgi:hypothetical protein